MAINFDFRSGAKKSSHLDYPLKSYGPKFVNMTGVKCRATSVAKNHLHYFAAEKRYQCDSGLWGWFVGGGTQDNLGCLLETSIRTYWSMWGVFGSGQCADDQELLFVRIFPMKISWNEKREIQCKKVTEIQCKFANANHYLPGSRSRRSDGGCS